LFLLREPLEEGFQADKGAAPSSANLTGLAHRLLFVEVAARLSLNLRDTMAGAAFGE
jgi:hypothetical protein